MSYTKRKKPGLRLLLIEDDLSDVLLFEQQLQEARERVGIGEVQVQVAHTTAEAEVILSKYPIDLILLDEGLSQQSGIAWLKEFKASEGLQNRVPVVMLTQRQEQEFIESAYQAYVSAYLIKSEQPGQLGRMIEALLVYWSQIAQLPPSVLPPIQAL